MNIAVQLRIAVATLVFVCLAALSPAPSQAYPVYTSLYAFGDSLSDVGNYFTATGGKSPAPPYYNGRVSNGPNWIDDISATLNLAPVQPSLTGGNDYAFAYARTYDMNLTIPTNPPGIGQQVTQFSKAHPVADPGALYTMWIGTNDVLSALYYYLVGTRTLADTINTLTTAAQKEVAALRSLVKLGAQNLLVALVPDIGKMPIENASVTTSTAATTLSQAYNSALAQGVGTGLSGASVAYVDTFTLFDQEVLTPQAYGFTNATATCYRGAITGGGKACANPSQYMFWDNVHPTSAGQATIASLALTALGPGSIKLKSALAVHPVPLPGSLAMAGGGLVLLALCGRRLRQSAPKGA